MENLQKAAHNVMSSKTDKEKMDSLCQAFELFTLDTGRLENAYDSLNRQFETLNLELQDANYNLRSKVAELDVVTNYLQNILDNITQGILFIDFNGIITTCNKAAENILGINGSQIVHRPYRDTFKDDAFGFSMNAILKGHQESATYNVSYVSPHNQLSELEVVTSFAIKNSLGAEYQNQGLVVMIRDVTEMRHLQTMAARADRMKVLGEMAAQVAHEIRNPLGGIKGFASLLKRDLKDSPELQKMAGYIVEGTDSLGNLVNQILHYARPIHPHPEKTDLIALLNLVKEYIKADANIYKANISILIDAPFKELILPLDINLFKSAMLNLMVNSIQAMPDGGTLTLSVRQQQGLLILSVADTGSGIPEELLSKLYSPFFTTKPEGNGLGLVEVQKVILAHGGTIDVASTVNQGTTFTIKLPLTRNGAK